MNIKRTIHEANAKRPKGVAYIHVPVVPTLGMMTRAANAVGVYFPGDRLADHILKWDADPCEPPPHVHKEVSDRFGVQEGYAMSVLADAWSGCIDGLDEWLVVRGREGSTPFATGWFRPIVDGCPEGGWPATKAEATDAHKAFAARRGDAFSASSNAWWGDDRRTTRIAPTGCAAIMALRARQRDTVSLGYLSVGESVDIDRLPYIPGFTLEDRYDSEERSDLLIAAMWKAAVSWLEDPDRTDDEPFPFDHRNHAAALTGVLQYRRKLTAACKDFHGNAPYKRVAASTPAGSVSAEATDRGVTYTAELANGSVTKRVDVDLRIPSERTLLDGIVAALDEGEGAACELVPLAITAAG
jgi:hypothetical protein